MNIMSEGMLLYIGVLIALFILAFLAAAAFSPIDRKVQVRSGTIEQQEGCNFCLAEDFNLTTFTLDVTGAIFLNERTTGFDALHRGRKVIVYYKKQGGKLIATLVRIIPSRTDFARESAAILFTPELAQA
ncbi:MAG: hypothetical protein ACTHMT_07420 [Verrucomicrobiota bacterium]